MSIRDSQYLALLRMKQFFLDHVDPDTDCLSRGFVYDIDVTSFLDKPCEAARGTTPPSPTAPIPFRPLSVVTKFIAELEALPQHDTPEYGDLVRLAMCVKQLEARVAQIESRT